MRDLLKVKCRRGYQVHKPCEQVAVSFLQHSVDETMHCLNLLSRSCDAKLDCCNSRLRKLFACYGRFVARYPRLLVAIPLCVGLLLGLGLLRLTFETNMEYLFTPTNSEAKEDRNIAEDLFPMNPAVNFSIGKQVRPVSFGEVIFTAKDGKGMMREVILEEILVFDQYLKNKTATAGLDFERLCARSSDSKGCYDDVFLTYLRAHGPSNVVRQSFTYPKARSKRVTHDHSTSSGNALFLGASVGGVTFYPDKNKLVQDFSAVKVGYCLRTPEGDSSGREWEELFLHLSFTFNSELLSVAPYTSHSLEEEFLKNGHAIIPMFVIAFIIMILFAISSVLLTDWVRSKPLIGLLGVCSTFLGILSSVGLLSAIGVEYSIVVGTMPMLLLGIGIDDMFIMVAAWRNTNPNHSVEQRMSDTLSEAAVSITITSLTDFLAFLIGIITVFPAVFGFCLFTAIAVLFDYIYQITFFAACLALDGYREDDNHHTITFQTVLPKSYSSDKSTWYRWLCSGGLKLDGKVVEKAGEHIASKFFKYRYGPFVTKPAVKVLVLLLFAGYLGVSIHGCTKVREGLELTDLVADDSYASDFLDKSGKYFTRYGPRVMFVITEPLNYWDESVQNRLLDLVKKVEGTEYVGEKGLTAFWLLEYMKHLRNVVGHADVTQKLFIRHLHRYLSHTQFKSDVKLSSDGESIVASRFFIQSINMSSSSRKIGLLREFRAIAAEFPVKTFPYYPTFPFYEQYTAVKPNTLQNIGIALVAMCVVAIFMIPHPFCAILIVVCIVSIDVGVVGVMTLWGVNLDAVSMISIILCIGFSVDFSAHITYAYMVSAADTRNTKIISALSEVGWPTVQSAFSTILGTVPLAFANSYVFQTFFKTLFLVIGIGFLHGIFVLPVVLSLIGPILKKKSDDTEMGSLEKLKDSRWDGRCTSTSPTGMKENPFLEICNGKGIYSDGYKPAPSYSFVGETAKLTDVYMIPESSL